MSRTLVCRIYAVPKEAYRQDQRDFICSVPVTAYFAGNKVVKFESDSTLPYISLVLSDLLNQYIGKHIGKNTEILVANVPEAAIKAHEERLLLEVGKVYKRRDGKLLRVVHLDRPAKDAYPFKAVATDGTDYDWYTPRGEYNKKEGVESLFDLIEEVAAPATQPQVEFTTTDSPNEPPREISAPEFLNTAARIMEERGRQYDQEGGERSMGKCVAAFNAITGRNLTESEGWLLMAVLKQVRLFQKPGFHKDSAEDGIAYTALLAEAKQREVA